MKYVRLVRAVAKFVAENKEDLDKVKHGGSRPKFYSAVAWYRPLYDLTGLLTRQMIPHLRQTWWDLPECRELFFADTGFEEKFMTKQYMNPMRRKPDKRITGRSK